MKYKMKRVRSSYYKKLTHMWDDDFKGKRKKRFITRLAKARQRKIDREEMGDGLSEWEREPYTF